MTHLFRPQQLESSSKPSALSPPLHLHGTDCRFINIKSQQERIQHFQDVSKFGHPLLRHGVPHFLRFLDQLIQQCQQVGHVIELFNRTRPAVLRDDFRNAITDELIVWDTHPVSLEAHEVAQRGKLINVGDGNAGNLMRLRQNREAGRDILPESTGE